MKHLEGDFYEKVSAYFKTLSGHELSLCQTNESSLANLKDLSDRVSRVYNYECYTKVYPSLGQHITYVISLTRITA